MVATCVVAYKVDSGVVIIVAGHVVMLVVARVTFLGTGADPLLSNPGCYPNATNALQCDGPEH